MATAGLIEGPLIGYAVTKLLNKILEACKLVVNRDKKFTTLCNLLQLLDPLVIRITKQKRSDDVADAWLKRLNDQLQKAEFVVQEYRMQSKYNIRSICTSQKVIKVTTSIRDMLQETTVLAWDSVLSNSQTQDGDAATVKGLLHDINEHLQQLSTELAELQLDVKKMELSEVTRKAFNTLTSSYSGPVNTVTIPDALQQIKNQADTIAMVHNKSNHVSYQGSTSSNAAQQPTLRTTVNQTIFGGDDVVEELKELLLSDDYKKWVGVWSMGGAGKTLTAQRVRSDPSIQRHFVGGSFWVTVGRERSTLSLLRQLFREIRGDHIYLPEENAKGRLESELMNRGKVLLVLDDVWRPEDRDCLDVVNESSGSVILVTTRNVEILESVFAKKLQIPMLSPDHSWELFCYHAFHGVNNVPPFLKGVAKQVAAECKGLPLALKVIGAAMAGKSMRPQWERRLKLLKHAEIISRAHEEKLFLRLQPSVEDLSGVHPRLVDCFYYFAAFPEDATVKVTEDLLGLLVGEGIVGNGTLSPEEQAYEFLGWLIARSLIELHSANNLKFGEGICYEYMSCKIHDVLRDLARHNLQHKLEVHERVCLYQPGLQLKRFPKEWVTSLPQTATTSAPLKVQKLSLMFNELEEFPSQLSAPDLKVLLVGHNEPLKVVPKLFFGGLLQLRILDLKFTGIAEIPAPAFCSLTSLVILDLSHCRQLVKLPDSVKHLRNLKELQLRNCHKLKALPVGLRCLTKLETFNTEQTFVWDHGQRGVSPSNLRWMGAFILRDLSPLTMLRKFTASSASLTSFPISKNSLELLTHLVLHFRELESFPGMNELTELEYLHIHSQKLTALPPSIAALSNLKKLDCSNCGALSCLPDLDKLPLLEEFSLSLCGVRQLPESFGHPGAFPSLQILDMSMWEDINSFPTLHLGAMPQLISLDMSGWSQLRNLPASFEVLTSLRAFNLSLCPELNSLEPAFNSNSFPNLEELVLQYTALTALPASLALLQKLVRLDLRDCPARNQLPVELENRPSLEIRR